MGVVGWAVVSALCSRRVIVRGARGWLGGWLHSLCTRRPEVSGCRRMHAAPLSSTSQNQNAKARTPLLFRCFPPDSPVNRPPARESLPGHLDAFRRPVGGVGGRPPFLPPYLRRCNFLLVPSSLLAAACAAARSTLCALRWYSMSARRKPGHSTRQLTIKLALRPAPAPGCAALHTLLFPDNLCFAALHFAYTLQVERP